MKTKKLFLGLLSALVIVSCMMMPVAMGAGRLVVYTPAPKTTTDLVVAMWNKKYPTIPVDIIASGTGEIATRLKTESVNPRADILLGGGTEIVDTFTSLLQPYKTVNDAAFKPEFKHPNHFYYGFTLPLQVFIVNTSMIKLNQAPKTWKELGEPKWARKVIMANPAVSASGFAQLNIMLQLYDWELIKKVVANANITSSSKLSYQGVANGEYPVGLTGEGNVLSLQQEGYPVKAIYPKDGTALRYDTVSMIKNCPDPENAKKFMDFITSKPVMTAIAKENGYRMARKDIPLKAGLIPTKKIKFMKYDEQAASDKKKDTLAKFDDIFATKKK